MRYRSVGIGVEPLDSLSRELSDLDGRLREPVWKDRQGHLSGETGRLGKLLRRFVHVAMPRSGPDDADAHWWLMGECKCVDHAGWPRTGSAACVAERMQPQLSKLCPESRLVAVSGAVDRA